MKTKIFGKILDLKGGPSRCNSANQLTVLMVHSLGTQGHEHTFGQIEFQARDPAKPVKQLNKKGELFGNVSQDASQVVGISPESSKIANDGVKSSQERFKANAKDDHAEGTSLFDTFENVRTREKSPRKLN